MKTALAFTLLSLLIACGGDSESTEVVSEPEIQAESTGTAENAPGEEIRAGSFSTIEDYALITSREQLISEFGEENLVDGESWYAEGTVKLANTVLTNPENGQVIKYLWAEDGCTLNFLEANYYLFDEVYSILGSQVVSSECGVSTGMSIQELREWNGADFSFFGFGWDYEGGIFQEEGTRIAECPVLIKLSFDLEIEVPGEYRGMYSDQVFNTADCIDQGTPVLIDRLTYYPAEN